MTTNTNTTNTMNTTIDFSKILKTDKQKQFFAELIHTGYTNVGDKARFSVQDTFEVMQLEGKQRGGYKTSLRKFDGSNGITYNKDFDSIDIDNNLIDEAFKFSASLIDYDARPLENVNSEILGEEYSDDSQYVENEFEYEEEEEEFEDEEEEEELELINEFEYADDSQYVENEFEYEEEETTID